MVWQGFTQSTYSKETEPLKCLHCYVIYTGFLQHQIYTKMEHAK